MKLPAWAKKQGISYTTAGRWFRDGRPPERAEQTATGTVIVHEEPLRSVFPVHAQMDRKDGSAMSWSIGIDLCVSALNVDLDMSAGNGKRAMLQTNVEATEAAGE